MLHKVSLTLFSLFFSLTVFGVELISAERYLRFVPGIYKDGVNEYLEMTGLKGGIQSNMVEESNTGIYGYQNKIQNKCFSALTRELLKRESVVPYSNKSQNLNKLTNTTKNTDVPSGWYWNLSLEVAGGDKNLAMMLVGVCGNDDAFCPSRGERVGDPRYREGSLGESTIMNDKLRNDIIRIQAPSAGGQVLPSKYYHVMGAAYMACSLVRHGIPGILVRKIQETLASTYRMHRFCQDPAQQPNNFYRNVQDMSSLLKMGYTVDEVNNITKTRPSYEVKGATELINLYSVLANDYQPKTDDERKKHLSDFASFADAYSILKNEIVKDKNCSSPQIFGQNIHNIKRYATTKRYRGRCKGLSRDRCEAAKKRLLTWWADAQWTVEQHSLGAEFAINNCTKEKDFFANFEKKSCEALKKLNFSPETLMFEYGLENIETSP